MQQNQPTHLWRNGGREALWESISSSSNPESEGVDVLIIGGGITGAGIFHEAVRQGHRVLLVEQKDFAWGTSSKSSKMVHGGLRYLGSGDIKLAYDSVRERQKLLEEVSGLVNPLPFLMAHYKGMFPGPRLFSMVLAVYDWMAMKWNHRYRRKVDVPFYAPGIRQDKLIGATCFGDAVTDDARLVMRVLQEGVAEGGKLLNYVCAKQVIKREAGLCQAVLQDEVTRESVPIRAKVVINATGAWTDELRKQLGAETAIRPLRGSHLIFPSWRLPVACAVSFFHPKDKRPVFAFPWEGTTVVGTTDLDHSLRAGEDIQISAEEVAYLIEAANHQFPGAKVQVDDAIASYSGVRPVVGTGALNPSSERREHSIWDDGGVISVAGGKLTTFRLIAQDVLKAASEYLPFREDRNEPIFQRHALRVRPDAMPLDTYRRLCGRYGVESGSMFEQWTSSDPVKSKPSLRAMVGNTETLWLELAWVSQNEMVVHLDDLLLRRTRIGLLLPKGGEEHQAQFKQICQPGLGWTDVQWEKEWERYQDIYRRYFTPPGKESGDLVEGNGALRDDRTNLSQLEIIKDEAVVE